jgi:hypothetical protein
MGVAGGELSIFAQVLYEDKDPTNAISGFTGMACRPE